MNWSDCGWKVYPVASLDDARPDARRPEGRKIPTPADYRRPEPDPLLRAWCDPDYAGKDTYGGVYIWQDAAAIAEEAGHDTRH